MPEKNQRYIQAGTDLFSKLSDTHYRTDAEGKITYVSSGVYELLGYRPEEALGQRLANLYLHPRERKKIVKTLLQSDGKAKYVSAQLRHKDGSIRWISTNAFAIKDEEGNFLEHVCNEDDVKSAEMIKKETRNCPKCAVPIFKTEGCDQMWCTECHTAFSWRTGLVVTGVVHNPHFYAWQNSGADALR